MNRSDNEMIRTGGEIIETRSDARGIAQPASLWSHGGIQRGSSLASYFEFAFIHKRLIMVCTLIGLMSGWLAILAWPRSYESTAKLMIRVGHESVSLDPTATTSSTLMLQKTQEEEVISALEVLNSRQVAETVVDRIGAEAIQNGVLPDKAPAGASTNHEFIAFLKQAVPDALYRILKAAGIKDDISDRELAVRKVQTAVLIYSPKKSNVITIEAQAETPQMAQAIADEVTRSFLDEHVKMAHTHGSREFFEKQSADVEKRVDELVAQRSQFMQDRNIVSIDANRELLTQQFEGVDRDMVVASGELKQVTSEIEDLKSKVADTDEEIIAAKTQAADLTWSGMRQRVYELEMEEQKIAAKFTEKHPPLKQIREQLEGARKILAKLNSDRVHENKTPNPEMTRLRAELQKQQTRAVGLESAIKHKQQQRAELVRQSDELLEHEREYIPLDRENRLMDANLQMLRGKLDEARVIDELFSNKISNVHIFQPATFVERATSPRKPILAAGFTVLGLFAGFALALVRHASSPYLRTRADVENELGVSVVSSIPRLPPVDSLRLREQKLYRETCQSLISEILLSSAASAQVDRRPFHRHHRG